MDEEDIKDVSINPIYAVVFDERFFDGHEPARAKEDWVKDNAKLMESIGEEAWLRKLLGTLSGKPADKDDQAIDPHSVVAVSESFYTDHKPLIEVDQWVQANVNGLKHESPESWLWRLLGLLETGSSK